VAPSEDSQIIDLTKIKRESLKPWLKENADKGSRFAVAVFGHGKTALAPINEPVEMFFAWNKLVDRLSSVSKYFTFEQAQLLNRLQQISDRWGTHLREVKAPNMIVAEGNPVPVEAYVDLETAKKVGKEYAGTKVYVHENHVTLGTSRENAQALRKIANWSDKNAF
jgi:hypothetical protein